jgi:hypothetical protein
MLPVREEAGRGLRWWGPRLLGVAALAVWARLTAWSHVFVDGAVLPRYPDTYYHLRQILRTVEEWPRVPVADPLLNWPEGGFSPWAPGFDWLGATLALAFGAGDDPVQAARVAAFLPLGLGVATTLAVVWIARAVAPRGSTGDLAALAAGVVFALLPSAVVPSALGRLDHHVAEVLSMALLGAWALLGARRFDASEADRLTARRFECLGAAAATLAGLFFAGAVLYVAIAVALVVALHLASERRLGWGMGSGAPGLVAAATALALVGLPSLAVHGSPFDFRFPSLLQPALLSIAAIGCAGAAALTHRVEAGSPAARLARRSGCLAGLVALVGIVGYAIAPQIAGQVVGGSLDWVARGDPWLAEIREFQPLFRSAALWRPSIWDEVYRFHGALGVLAPLVLAGGCVLAFARSRATGFVFSGWTLAVLALSLLQLRFGRILTIQLAVSAGLVLAALARALAARQPRLRPALVVAVALSLLVVADPATRTSLRWRPAREPSPLEAAALALGRLASDRTGVLAPWDWGHPLLALSGRGVVSAGFGPWVGPEGYARVVSVLDADEAALLSLMDERRLGWLATGISAFRTQTHEDMPRGSARALDPRFLRSVPLSPLAHGGGGVAALEVPHVEALMPRRASPEVHEGLAHPVFRIWLYERVPGARLVGRATPGARVVARTGMRVHGARLAWEAWGDADPDGSFEIRVPMPNAFVGDGFESAPIYALSAQGEPLGAVVVSEADVRSGARVPASSEALAWERARDASSRAGVTQTSAAVARAATAGRGR